MAKKKRPSKKTTSRSKSTKRSTSATRKRVCGMMEHHHYLAQTDEAYQRNCREIERFSANARLRSAAERTSILRIPVVVHVIYNNAQQNISQEQIESQIEALNRDYRLNNADQSEIPDVFSPLAVDTMIEFALAVRDPQGNATTGITRTYTSREEFPYNRFDQAAIFKLNQLIKRDEFGKVGWPRDSYLNMWVCEIEGGLLGYASFPGESASTDGVVINHSAFGMNGTAQAPFNLGRTAVHEVGHWLNLLHIWGDDGVGCGGSDNISDTPNQASSNGGKPTFPKISCNNGPNGDMFMNYMDYVDDAAMFMFTQGQLNRINDTLSGPRAPLADSMGLTPVSTERVSLGVRGESLAEAVSSRSESGSVVEKVFDGVSWVPID